MTENKYSDIPISKNTAKGMTLTSDDRQYLQRMLSVQDDSWNEAFDKNIAELTKALAEVIQESNSRMFSLLEEQGLLIREIQGDIKDIKQSIEHLNLDIKDIRLEIKAIKVDVKSISLDIENLQNRVKDHDFRIIHLENHIEKHEKPT